MFGACLELHGSIVASVLSKVTEAIMPAAW
jgi:hypothetical protein